ncbi:DUF1292 domain-containing protein [Paenibacillus xylaniclasticus]|uniref:DUF1292 domain-containing protein n=1 Tax=Paenibacillus xylaniclasticus TaxID=588083 RepID=UPI001763F9C5|nr:MULTISPECIES: DUF1292 domain-containing protein [Paenibacillus]GFN33571.1 hypothetical protein PCURB6_38310 [Paenibacillus curdlanolyticus]
MHETDLMPQRGTKLVDKYGKFIELTSENGSEETYRIMSEFQLGQHYYAALQSEAMRNEGEVEMLRLIEGNELELENIEDDEEWESAAEAYDLICFDDTGK